MTAIVVNTLTGAVSEYDWNFQSLTPTHAGDAVGLYQFGGDLDNTAPIDATIMTGRTEWGSSLRKLVELVYFAIIGSGWGKLRVNEDEVLFKLRTNEQSRAKPGRAARTNFWAFGFRNVDGAAFRLDRIEVPIVLSKSRRA